MSYINNMNPRRMIWFNQNAPKNKMDLWLSYNKHYEDTSEDETTDTQETTDNPSQRSCDLILKAWDCGKWVPIVGFNTTAANKIDTVTGVDYTIDGVTHSGKNVYHPAIFTAESPNELYDAGSLGELLKDTHFVTEGDWNDIYNEYIKEVIESSGFLLWRAEPNRLGGIKAGAFRSLVPQNELAEASFNENLVNPGNDRLYIWAKDVYDAMQNWLINPGTELPEPIPTPIGGTFENTSSIGSSLLHTSSNPNAFKALIYNVNSGNAGKFLRVKPLSEWPEIPSGQDAPTGGWNQLNCLIEWTDIPEGAIYTSGTLIDVDNTDNTIGIDASSAIPGDVIICDDGVARWANVPQMNIISHTVDCEEKGVLINGDYIELVADTPELYQLINSWNRYVLLNYKVFLGFENVIQSDNPIYISVNSLDPITVVADDTTEKVIDSGGCLTGSSVPAGNYLFTLQFGVVKIEQIQSVSNS